MGCLWMGVVLPFYNSSRVDITMRTTILLGGVWPHASRPHSPYGVVCWVVLLGHIVPME
jgi:hypothetical protein